MPEKNESCGKKKINESFPRYEIAKRLVKFLQEYDWFDYQDSLEFDDTEEDAVERMLNDIQSKDGIRSVIKGLEELDMRAFDSNDKNDMAVIKERENLIADLKKLPGVNYQAKESCGKRIKESNVG